LALDLRAHSVNNRKRLAMESQDQLAACLHTHTQREKERERES